MSQTTIHLKEFQAHYEVAAQRYRRQNVLACFIPLALGGIVLAQFLSGH